MTELEAHLRIEIQELVALCKHWERAARDLKAENELLKSALKDATMLEPQGR